MLEIIIIIMIITISTANAIILYLTSLLSPSSSKAKLAESCTIETILPKNKYYKLRDVKYNKFFNPTSTCLEDEEGATKILFLYNAALVSQPFIQNFNQPDKILKYDHDNKIFYWWVFDPKTLKDDFENNSKEFIIIRLDIQSQAFLNTTAFELQTSRSTVFSPVELNNGCVILEEELRIGVTSIIKNFYWSVIECYSN